MCKCAFPPPTPPKKQNNKNQPPGRGVLKVSFGVSEGRSMNHLPCLNLGLFSRPSVSCCLSLVLPASLHGFIQLCPKVNHKGYLSSQEPGWYGVNMNNIMQNLLSLSWQMGGWRKRECLPITLALKRLRPEGGEPEATEQSPFSKANNYGQEEQQWLLFMKH